MKDQLDIVIVGGVAGGATAAARARRVNEHANITIVERGGYVSYANCGLPYFISGDIKDRKKLLLQTPEGFYERYRIQVQTGTEAVGIDRQRKQLHVRNAKGAGVIPYDVLILSQGAQPFVPALRGLPASNAFALRSVEDMDAIDAFIRNSSPKTAVVAGGGFIGLEMAEALHSRGIKVSVVEKLPQLMPPLDVEFADMVRQHLEANAISVHVGAGLLEVQQSAVLTDTGLTLDADLVILSMGVKPELTLAKDAGLEIGSTGGVTVNGRMQSSDPSIYAVGDMAEVVHSITGRKVRIPLAGPANRQGRVAGSNAAGERLTYHGAMGTSIVKVCDRTAGSTGLTEKAAREAGLETDSAYVHANHHAGYYPGARQLTMKLVFQKSTGRILGAQAFGEEGVDKRIDVIATAIAGHLNVEDLESLDLAYAPPYSSANDPVNTLGFVAMNHVRGFSQIVSPMKFREMLSQAAPALIVDVRNADETAKGHVLGAHLIPLPQLRDRVNELPKRDRVFVYCQSGMRSHLASRILAGAGFPEIYNVSGGYRSITLIPS